MSQRWAHTPLCRGCSVYLRCKLTTLKDLIFSFATQPIRCPTIPASQLVFFTEPGAELPSNICRWLASLWWDLRMFSPMWRCLSLDTKSSLALFSTHSIKQTHLHMLLIWFAFRRKWCPEFLFLMLLFLWMPLGKLSAHQRGGTTNPYVNYQGIFW